MKTAVNGDGEQIRLSATDITSMVRDERFAHNVASLIDIGRNRFQEAAFAVYASAEGRDVSDLLVPDPVGMAEGDILETKRLSEQVDTSPLVRTRLTFDSATHEELRQEEVLDIITDDSIGDLDHLDPSQFSSKAWSKIKALLENPDISPHIRQNLISKIALNDKIPPRDQVRNDVIAIVHNHPLHPALELGTEPVRTLDGLMRPSRQDIWAYENHRTYNPAMIEGIVGATQAAAQLLFYRALVPGQTRPSYYEARFSPDSSIERNLGQLALAGYQHVLIDLRDDGQPKNRRQTERAIRNFCA